MELVVSFPYIRLAKVGNPRSCNCCHRNYCRRINYIIELLKTMFYLAILAVSLVEHDEEQTDSGKEELYAVV